MRIGDLPNLAILLATTAAVFVAGFLVLAGLGDSTTNTAADNAVANLTAGMTNITTYAPTWGVIIGVAVLLGIVLYGFGFARNKGYI